MVRRFGAFWLVFAVLAPAAVHAHSQQFPVEGRYLKIDTRREPARHTFSFRSPKQILISPAHDPRETPTRVLIRWEAGGGAGDGRTELVELDPEKWNPLGNRGLGYRYHDPAGTRGGIRGLIYKLGKLTIIAKGFDWELPGPIDSAWVHFQVEDEWYCANNGGVIRKNEDGLFRARNSSAPGSCPEQVCGNGVTELGEECDDGNLDDDDECTNACEIGVCSGEVAEYDSTMEAIQSVVFEGYGCADTLCHAGGVPAGGLDLSDAATSHAALVNVPSTISVLDRVEPGDEVYSFLYNKIAAKTFSPSGPFIEGSPMPANTFTVTEDHLAALRLFIRAGAPETGVVEGTAELLGSCLPPPSPNKLPPLDPPALGEGFQILAPGWDLPAQSENEVCYATYYDLDQVTGAVPASAEVPCPDEMGGPGETCVLWNQTTLGQDPQSHHSIIRIYLGAEDVDHPSWGPWQCLGGANDGLSCDPDVIGVAAPGGNDCGPDSGCAGRVQTSLACLGYGPADFGFSVSGSGTPNAPNIGGSQEPLYTYTLPTTVRSVLPKKAIVVFNSHAFNLTDTDTTMAQYFNVYFADSAVDTNQAEAIFDSASIFAMNVPPFESQEICRTYRLPSNAQLFELNSHMHKRGALFRIWGPPNTSCTPGPGCTPNPGPPIYQSTVYNDPVHLVFDPPIDHTGLSGANRRYKYCAIYDNGATNMEDVKRRSTSPPGLVGGPCGLAQTRCIGGPQHNQLCNGNHAFCDSAPGAGDGDCDACPLTGGVTTEDEMFILLGGYYVP